MLTSHNHSSYTHMKSGIVFKIMDFEVHPTRTKVAMYIVYTIYNMFLCIPFFVKN
uniref:Uncharacterized protein n=1 Tax=Lepeophtheirus salmonis TaxID=72036 RepID=A0A0K2V4V0_LEPSM